MMARAWGGYATGIGRLARKSCLSVALFIACWTPVTAQTFTPPAALNTNAVSDSGSDSWPQITTDGGGNWVAVWQSWDSLGGAIGGDLDILFARSTDNGATWTAPAALNTNAAADSGADEFPQISTDGGGNWVAVWRSWDSLGGTIGTDYDILVARSTDDGATWTAPAALNTNAATDSREDWCPQISTDGANWIAVWQSFDTLGGTIGLDSDILVARSTDDGATWTTPAALNTNAASDSREDYYPQISTDGGGNWVAVWQSNDSLGGTIGLDLDILVARSTDDGATWTAPAALNTNAATDASQDEDPQISTDGSGNWVAVWGSNNSLGGTIGTDADILVARSTDDGATWTAPAALNSNAATDSNWDGLTQISTDGSGNWVAVWESSDSLGGTIGTDADILVARSTNDGATWMAPVALNTNAATDSGSDLWPQVGTDSGGNWVAVWGATDSLGGTIGGDADILVATGVICGDGFQVGDEGCDDGNLIDDDGCSSSCTACGDGILKLPEQCDDGNTEDGDGCSSACTLCGDSLILAPETCDDGNSQGGDGCSPHCQVETCTAAPGSMKAWFSFDYQFDGRNLATLAAPGVSPGADAFVDPNGKVKGALVLDGSGDHAGGVSSSQWDIGGNFTIEAWVRPDTLSGDRTIVSRYTNDGGTSRGWALTFINSSLGFAIQNFGQGVSTPVLVGQPFQTGQWYHVAVTRDNTDFRLYLDGQEISSGFYSDATPNPASAPLCIGCIGETPLIDFFQGAIDELTIVNSTLSQPEIQAIYDAGSGGKCKPCTDDVQTTGEQCDGTEDANCPGSCDGSCMCPAPVCNNGVRELGEDCDGADALACPGLCSECACPVCGNGVQELGESCDIGDDLTCPGNCEVDCTCPNLAPPEASTGTVPAGGTVSTDGEMDGTTPVDPVETAVTSPTAGDVSIAESEAPDAVAGFQSLGFDVIVTAPDATVADPLVLVFTFDASLLPPGIDETNLRVFRNGVAVADCPGSSQAVPDPCISDRQALGGDGVAVTVLTASTATLPASAAISRGAAAPVALSGGGGAPTVWSFAVAIVDHYVAYQAKAPKRDVGGAEISDKNTLPKPWVVTVNDIHIDDGDADDPENFVISKPKYLMEPAQRDLDAAVNQPALPYVYYKAKSGKEGVGPEVGGKFPRPAKHVPRTWALQNALGTINVLSKKVSGIMVPTATDGSSPPAAPNDATHFVCYKVKVAPDTTDQTPDGKLRKDLQAFFQDTLGTCGTDETGQPSFSNTAVAGSCLFRLRKPAELCNPMTKTAVEAPRETAATGIEESTASTDKSLLCYKAKLASKVTSAEAATLADAAVGDRIEPKQAKQVARRVKTGDPIYTTPGNQFPYPTLVETKKQKMVCLPTDVLSVTP